MDLEVPTPAAAKRITIRGDIRTKECLDALLKRLKKNYPNAGHITIIREEQNHLDDSY